LGITPPIIEDIEKVGVKLIPPEKSNGSGNESFGSGISGIGIAVGAGKLVSGKSIASGIGTGVELYGSGVGDGVSVPVGVGYGEGVGDGVDVEFGVQQSEHVWAVTGTVYQSQIRPIIQIERRRAFSRRAIRCK